MEPYGSTSLHVVIFDEVDSFPSKHVLFNVLDFDLTYDAIIGILALCQYQSIIIA
jgi:hypothetical protein